MRFLVVTASRHGSTAEIAEAIADELRRAGHEATVRAAAHITTIEPYDAVIIGSAIYMGSWLAEAQDFVRRNEKRLGRVPVWLFSSGPLGAPEPQPSGDPPSVGPLIEMARARGHQTFVGKLDPHELSFGEQLIARMVKAPAGDFRDWHTIRAWAREIAAGMSETSAE